MDKMLCGKIYRARQGCSEGCKMPLREKQIRYKKIKTKPISSFIFLGPTGVGKCFLGETNVKIRSKITGNEELININNLIDKFKNNKK